MIDPILLIQGITVIVACLALWHQIRVSNKLREEELRKAEFEKEKELEYRSSNLFSILSSSAGLAIKNRNSIRSINRQVDGSEVTEKEFLKSEFSGFTERNESYRERLLELSKVLAEIEGSPDDEFAIKLRHLRREAMGIKAMLEVLNVQLSKWAE